MSSVGIGGVPLDQEDPRADLTWGTIGALVDQVAERFDAIEAVVDGDVRLTFAQLAGEVDAYARGFMAAGTATGDRVAIWAPNCVEWMLAALGALRAGAVLVPLNTRFKGSEAAYILQSSGATVLATVRGFLGFDYPAMLQGEDVADLSTIVLLRDEGGAPDGVIALADFLAAGQAIDPNASASRAAAVRPDDTSDLIFTSGTTGYPKGAATTHAQSLRTFGTWASIVGLAPGDRYLIVNPFFHTFGYKAGILACLMAGATVVPEPVFDPKKVMVRIAEERISVLPGPPTLYQSVLADPQRAAYDLSSLRLGVTGAAVVPVELVHAMRDELGFSTVLTAYGLTESCGTVTMCRRSDSAEVIAHTSGRAIPGLEVQVVVDGEPVPAGQPGEIVVRGYTVMSGYWGNPEATAEAIDPDGWLHTGDIGVMDAQGNIAITDRLKDMFVVGGFNAYPAEIEAALRRHPSVGQVAVVGVPDQRMGEVGCAYIVPSATAGGLEAGDLGRTVLEWARDAMANYKVPRSVVIVEALPVNASGKVLKRELRDRMAAGKDQVVTSERSK
ncbi:MAG TPA: FadD3 family acyl-CoA ligase [Acidimicrobiales bacterium]|jgi:acyl-CoA synthetase (AMP-forming)/AMP-acid ligase II